MLRSEADEILTPEQWEEIERERLADEEAEYEMVRRIENSDDKSSLTFKQVDERTHRVFNRKTQRFYDLELEIDVVY